MYLTVAAKVSVTKDQRDLDPCVEQILERFQAFEAKWIARDGKQQICHDDAVLSKV